MNSKLNQLSAEEERIILNKGTEAPFSGKYNDFDEAGVFVCKHCDLPLYKSEDKFSPGCGWPSFDDEIDNRVQRQLDADGQRVEIVCSQCGGHLGHVFEGEELTEKNTRHCVNSLSVKFVPESESDKYTLKTERAYYAGGCFWGLEHLMQQLVGVISVTSGYMGGDVENPTYEQVCSKSTGHLEVVEVEYNPELVDYETLTKLFFETHDPTQTDGQGPDLGPQYLSAIFYKNDSERAIGDKLIAQLKEIDLEIATELRPLEKFWPAENYHQDYYARNGKEPYCHRYRKLFA